MEMSNSVMDMWNQGGKRCKQAIANIPTRLHDSYHIELNNYFHFEDKK